LLPSLLFSNHGFSLIPVTQLTLHKQNANLTVVWLSAQITSGYCPKTWEVNNKLTDTTAGNFCAGKKYSSMYSCAADCRYTSTSLNQTICHGLPDKLSYTSGTTHCSFVSRSLPALPQALLAIVVSTRCQLCCSCAFCVVTSCEMPTDRHPCLSWMSVTMISYASEMLHCFAQGCAVSECKLLLLSMACSVSA